jgi:hypothetical protein
MVPESIIKEGVFIFPTKLPNFLVVGAPKSGTTTIQYCLKQHPQIYLPDKIEYVVKNELKASYDPP